MSIVSHLGRPHDFTRRRSTADDFAREARCLRGGAGRHDRFLHGRVAVGGPEISRCQCAAPVGAGVTIDCAGNEIVAPSATRDSLAGKARTGAR